MNREHAQELEDELEDERRIAIQRELDKSELPKMEGQRLVRVE